MLNNLVSNAVKFTPSGGKVTIRLQEVKDDASWDGAIGSMTFERRVENEGSLRAKRSAQLHGWKHWTTLSVLVSDTGSGIESAQIARLFNPFPDGILNAKFGRESAGLGLFIARGIARQHGGDVRVDSEVGKGSSFEVRIACGVPGTSDANSGDSSPGVVAVAGSGASHGMFSRFHRTGVSVRGDGTAAGSNDENSSSGVRDREASKQYSHQGSGIFNGLRPKHRQDDVNLIAAKGSTSSSSGRHTTSSRPRPALHAIATDEGTMTSRGDSLPFPKERCSAPLADGQRR